MQVPKNANVCRAPQLIHNWCRDQDNISPQLVVLATKMSSFQSVSHCLLSIPSLIELK